MKTADSKLDRHKRALRKLAEKVLQKNKYIEWVNSPIRSFAPPTFTLGDRDKLA